MSICDCASNLGIPVGAGAGPWLNVQCVAGELVVEDKSTTGGGGGSCDPVSPLIWGSAPLEYYGTEALGAPVFCSATGLRTVPDHYNSRQRLDSGASVNPGALAAGGTHLGTAASSFFSNVSAARIARVFAAFDVGMTLSNTGFCTDARLSAVVSGGSYSGTFQLWRGNPGVQGANLAINASLHDAFSVSPAGITLAGTLPAFGPISVTPKFECLTGGMAAGTVSLTAALTFVLFS